ncbi:MAG: hypothetical protein PHX61_07205 [Alphaproteobacteria bacterium]|nr:hypothetical protein [Alphaproteobacteria bacterium]
MRVKCIKDDLSNIIDSEVRERLSQTIHITGPITTLDVGKEYLVQAVEVWEGGVWVYLQTYLPGEYPYHYPIEMFEVVDNKLPEGWSVQFEEKNGNITFKRICIPEWADDEEFYAKLIDGDPKTVALYRKKMR